MINLASFNLGLMKGRFRYMSTNIFNRYQKCAAVSDSGNVPSRSAPVDR